MVSSRRGHRRPLRKGIAYRGDWASTRVCRKPPCVLWQAVHHRKGCTAFAVSGRCFPEGRQRKTSPPGERRRRMRADLTSRSKDQPTLRVRMKPSGPNGASMTTLRTRDWLWGHAVPGDLYEVRLAEDEQHGLCPKIRSHAPRLSDGVDIGVIRPKVTIVHGAKCRKWTCKSAMLVLHGRLLRKYIGLRSPIAARLR